MGLRPFLLVALAACSSPSPRTYVEIGPPDQRLLPQQEEAAVEVRVTCRGRERRTVQNGTGVLIGPFEVLTAGHVVECAEGTPTIRVAGKKVRIEHEWRSVDVARLRTVDDDFGPIRSPSLRGWRGVRPGETLIMQTVAPSRQTLVGVATGAFGGDTYGSPTRVWYTMPTISGNSGSASYDSKGYIISIHTGRDVTGSTYGALVTSEMLR